MSYIKVEGEANNDIASQSSDSILIMMQQPILDALDYHNIEFDRAEWDNIPPILTKFCLNLDRYMAKTLEYLRVDL